MNTNNGSHHDPASQQRGPIVTVWRRVWPVLRQVLGWFFIVLGLLGIVLPVLQGVLFLVIGIALVGRRNVVIRWAAVRFKQFVRRWAALDMPLVGWLGRLALRAQHETSRRRRQLHWWRVERRARAVRCRLVTNYEYDSSSE